MSASLFLMGCLAVHAAPAREPLTYTGGCGGAWFLAETGELVVEVFKRDRNRGAATELRALLLGPDREVLDQADIPFAGGERGAGLGPVQRAVLSTQVTRPGVYGLNITVSNDRYGESIVWGIWTNCPKYLLETARGHRDARHEEPIVLFGDAAGQVGFLPRAGSFELELSDLPAEVREVAVFDERDQRVAGVPIADGRGSHAFAADPARGQAPWRIHLPRMSGTIQADGLTRWESTDRLPDHCLWTPDVDSWFAWHDNRWLLSPYRQVRFGRPGEVARAAFELHNNADRPRTIDLALEFDGPPWPVSCPASVELAAGEAAQVTVEGAVPAEGERTVRLRATPRGEAFSTWSTLRLLAGDAPAYQALELPLRLQPYAQDREQLGYAPDYPLEQQPYFDAAGRAAVRTSAGVALLRDGAWTERRLAEAVVERVPEFDEPITGVASQKVCFDGDGDIYLLAAAGRKQVLLHSADDGVSFRAYVIPGDESRGRALDIEQFSGHNALAGPPPIARNTAVPTEPDPRLFWRRVNQLDLFVPRKVGGRIELGQPIRVSEQSLGLSGHSGTPSALVSRGEKVHIVWGEATDPAEQVPGVPTFVATYDRATGTLGPAMLVGYGAPANDVHNTPTITMDSRGYLHVLTGTHGRPFGYARSLLPNDSAGGITPAETTGENLSQTYLGLVCGPDDTLHLVYRLNRSRVEPYPLAYHTALAYQRKRPDAPWAPPRLLVLPPFSEYSIYYHRLTIDPAGSLFLSYDYWSTYWHYRNDRRTRPRSVLISRDAGDHWSFW